MMGGDRRLVSAGAEFRIGNEPPVAAWLMEVGAGRVRFCLRDADAVAARQAAWDGARLTLRSEVDGGRWVEVEELRFGPGHGGGDTALRSVVATAPEGGGGSSGLPELNAPQVVVAVEDERAVAACRALPELRGARVALAKDIRDREAVGVLVLGGAPGREPEVAETEAVVERLPGLRAVVLAEGGAGSSRWAGLMESGVVFFAGRRLPEPEWLGPLLAAALADAGFRRAFRGLVGGPPERDGEFPDFAWFNLAILGQRREAQETLRDLGAQAERRMPEATATVYAYDEWEEALLGPHLGLEEEFAESAASGLIAYAVRTGRAVLEQRMEDTAFFDPELDLAHGGEHSLLVVPIRDFAGTVLGVLACRPADDEARLGPESLRAAVLLASEFAPPLATLREYDQLRGDGGAGADPSVFRAEAIEAYGRSESPSSILNVSERWGSWIVGGLAALFLGFVAFLVFGTATDYAEGTAVVHSRGRIPVVANEGGTVAAIRLAPGAEVGPGDVIGTLYDHAELAQVRRLEHEYEDALVRLLRDPTDPAAGGGLPSLRGASEQARADLEERQLIAPVAGVLTDVRVRQGALVTPGQTVATIGAAGPGFEIVAAVPGNFRPLLTAGAQVVAELEQFPGSRFHLTAREISPEVIGAEEARALMGRLLPAASEDAALALVYADLPEVLTSSTGAQHPLYDGMRGSVRIPVREERFIVALWPALNRGR